MTTSINCSDISKQQGPFANAIADWRKAVEIIRETTGPLSTSGRSRTAIRRGQRRRIPAADSKDTGAQPDNLAPNLDLARVARKAATPRHSNQRCRKSTPFLELAARGKANSLLYRLRPYPNPRTAATRRLSSATRSCAFQNSARASHTKALRRRSGTTHTFSPHGTSDFFRSFRHSTRLHGKALFQYDSLLT